MNIYTYWVNIYILSPYAKHLGIVLHYGYLEVSKINMIDLFIEVVNDTSFFFFFNAMKVRLRSQLENLIWIIMSEKTLSGKNKKQLILQNLGPMEHSIKRKLHMENIYIVNQLNRDENNKENNIWLIRLREDI